MMEKVDRLIILILISCVFLGCQPENKNNSSKENVMKFDKIYSLQLGVDGENKFIEYAKDSLDKQPAGMSFRDMIFTPPNLGKVSLDVAEQKLILDHVFSVMGSNIDYDPNLKGIQTIDINAGLNKEEFVTEEQAYQAYVNLFQQLNRNGWKNHFDVLSPRIAKEDNIKSIYDDSNVIDPAHIFTYEEWRKIFNEKVSLYYNLYLNGVYMGITLNKRGGKEDKVQYMLRLNVSTIKYRVRNSISKSYKMSDLEFKKAYDNDLLRTLKIRLVEEKERKTNGYHIDENYKDPDVWNYVK